MNASGVAWDKIIAAAAASTLGVLSLGVLLVGVLAYLFFGRSDDRVKLSVFGAIMLAVVGLGGAVLHESRSATPAPNPSPDPGPSPSAATAPAEPPAPSSPAADRPSASPLPDNSGAAATATVAGLWRDTDGYLYRVAQSGDQVSFAQFTAAGVQIGGAMGTINGRALTYRYSVATDGDQGVCQSTVDASAAVLDGRCKSDGRPNSWPVHAERVQ